MAILKQAEDDHYYTVAYAGDAVSPATYQIKLEGIAFLAQHNIKVGSKIPYYLLAELKRKKWMFTGGSGVGEPDGFFEPDAFSSAQFSSVSQELELAINFVGSSAFSSQQEGFRLARIILEKDLPAEQEVFKSLGS